MGKKNHGVSASPKQNLVKESVKNVASSVCASVEPENVIAKSRPGLPRSAPYPTPTRPDLNGEWGGNWWHSGGISNSLWTRNKEISISEWNMIPFQKLGFTKWEIMSNLTDKNLIGHGGLGKVYRVVTNQTRKTVAVKSIRNEKKSDHRLEKEFPAETRILGTIRHNNIVKLLCCISGKDLKLLVYEYFKNRSLDQWLHFKTDASSMDTSFHVLDWPRRLHIAIGAAQGICYMHHECSPPIIHRDIKSSNILLDSEFNAKIADFGLAKILSRLGDPEIASALAGTFGYIAPEYAYTSKVTTKSDIYSFGVVLLELTTGRGPVTPDEPTNLAGWAWTHQREKNSIIDALDERIKEPCYLEEMSTVFRLGLMCTSTLPSNRPFIKDVLQILQNCRGNPSSRRS
ncbi:Protein kinase family protein with leucine-rich repeat domain [Abeliophyllum distichum]|uniref:Protein kinase family protein with leucine-rich repeat domain n=1 Tax=Abeliophyllum distichum TaxID=126358 RepID=A0ABD1TYB9_9LAMI